MSNPEIIEIEGLKTIHKLCKFGADHNMEGCSFTKIVERMFDELQSGKASAVADQVLDAPACVGGGTFQPGVKWSTVIGAAQRHYENDAHHERPVVSVQDQLRIASGHSVVVPRKPTPKMIDATWHHDDEIQEMSHNTRNEFIYTKMIEARDKPDAQ